MTERPDRPDPLDRLDVFDRVGVPDQWDDIAARAREPELARLHAVEPADRRPRWLLAAAAAAVLVIGAGAVIAVNADDDDGEITTATNPPTAPVVTTAPFEPITSTVPPSTEPGTVAPQSTVPATAPLTAPPATVPAVAAPALVPWCAETIGGPVAPPPGDASAFGPIDVEASLTITLPNGTDGIIDNASVARGVQPVDAGVLVLVQQTAASPEWQLVAINLDGSIRWRRCGSEQPGFAIHVGRGSVFVREQAEEWAAWRGFDVVTGVDVVPLPLDPALIPISATDRYVLVANDTYTGDLQLADLVTGVVADVPEPPFDLTEIVVLPPVVTERVDGSPLVRIDDGTAVLAVYLDGAWRTDRDTLLREVPLNVTETYDGDLSGLGTGVLARDPLGATVWFHDTVNGIRAEGWATGVLGDVVLTNECRADDPNVSYGCAEQWHVALDLETGDLLWERPGFVAVGPAEGTLALLADDDGWSLVDVRTGDVIQSDLPGFATACCGEDAFIWSDRVGGVVWSVDYQTVRIHYRLGSAPAPVEVTLDS